MKLRTTLRIRNDEMIAARERLGLSQGEAAAQAGVPLYFLQACEKLDYSNTWQREERVLRLSAFLELLPEQIMPEDLQGTTIQNTFTVTAEVNTPRLLEGIRQFQARNLLPAPDEECERGELVDLVKKFLPTLSYREREIMKLLYGLDPDKGEYTRDQVARIFRVNQERVRQVEAKALMKLRHRFRQYKRRHGTITDPDGEENE